MKLLIVSPHLSTGGSPQYLLNYMEEVREDYEDIRVVEFTNFSSAYVIQKNKIMDFLGEGGVVTLGQYGDWDDDELFLKRRKKLIDMINGYDPDVIYMAEFPECYEYKLPPSEVMDFVYRKERRYKIVETTHNNSFDFKDKIYLPDNGCLQ